MTSLLVVTSLFACGPFFPNWLLDEGEPGMLSSPRLLFSLELQRLRGLRSASFKTVTTTNDHPIETLNAEVMDLDQALRSKNTSDDERERIVLAYQSERERLNKLRAQISEWRAWDTATQAESSPNWEQPQIPDGLPREFAGYFQGAIEFVSGRTNEARFVWEQVLNLPAEERHFRSVWAAFMLGKLDVDTDPVSAIKRFREVRELTRLGFSDGLGLAASSLGWEARAAFRQGDYTRAIDLYLEQQATGNLDSTSLRFVASAAVEGSDEAFKTLAAYPPSRRVITAFLLSNCGCSDRDSHAKRSRKWLTALHDAGVVEPEAAEQFALVAYQAGEFELADQWLALAPPDSVAALWLKAKLKLRDGDLETAANLLASATRLLPLPSLDEPAPPPRLLAESLEVGNDSAARRMRGELGVLHLQKREFVEAVDVMLRADYWADAAFLADRVLTLDELKNYVDLNWPPAVHQSELDATERQKPSASKEAEDKRRSDIRYLLARRLTRADRFSEARPYFPPEWRPAFDDLVEHLNVAEDTSRSKSDRATAFWSAAQLTRTNGMELFGTALEPDWQIWDGEFEDGGPSFAIRATIPEASPLHPSDDETKRIKSSAPDPDHRFHYRYLAANLAWKAADLMPDQSDETAHVLCAAGSWLKARDPKYADYFYKALVIRCGRTELGTAADRKRWFPRMYENGQLAEAMPPPVATTYSGAWPGDEERVQRAQ
ncbi:hypothetical protein GC207_11885 [bacterium]|nr:hypothetical protein [bacterium]